MFYTSQAGGGGWPLPWANSADALAGWHRGPKRADGGQAGRPDDAPSPDRPAENISEPALRRTPSDEKFMIFIGKMIVAQSFYTVIALSVPRVFPVLQ